MHVRDVTLDVYKQNLNVGLLQQRYWKVWSALDIFFFQTDKKDKYFFRSKNGAREKVYFKPIRVQQDIFFKIYIMVCPYNGSVYAQIEPIN